MKVGDRVRVLQGDHSFEGEIGVIVLEREASPFQNCRHNWDFDVDFKLEGWTNVPFFAKELEVINE